MKRLRFPLLLLALLLPAATATAQAPAAPSAPGVNEEQPDKDGLTHPGKGPQIPFDETRWEFWWYYNREPLIGLRRALVAGAAATVDVDEPFQAVTARDREHSLIPHVVSALRDANPFVRISAVHSLAKTRDPGVRPSLFQALRDEQFLVRLHAILALGVWGETVSLPRLEELVRDKKAELQERMYAGLALGLIGGPQAAECFRGLLSLPAFLEFPTMVQAGLAYGAGLAGGGENAVLVRGLLAERALQDYVVRSYLLLSLGKCGEASDAALLLVELRGNETQLRRSAAIALGSLLRRGADEQAVAALAQAAHEDADVMVRNFSWISLGYIGGDAAVRLLRADLEAETKGYRPFIALALGLGGDPENVPVLLHAFTAESDNSYRGALAVALGLQRDGRAAPALREAFQTAGEPVFRGYAALALGMIGDLESIPDIEGVFASAGDVELMANAATALGLLGARAAAGRIAARIPQEKNEYVRQSLLYALGLMGDRAAIDPLAAVVHTKEEVAYVRAYAVTSLGLLGDAEEVRAIARASRDSNYTIVSDFLTEVFRTL